MAVPLIYDYKTGTPPSKKEQQVFDKQLLIEAAMVEEGGFKEVGAANCCACRSLGWALLRSRTLRRRASSKCAAWVA
jgi:RecB family exonuclease